VVLAAPLVLPAFAASNGALAGVNLSRSDSAHITEIGQSYAEKKSVTTVVRSARTSDVDVVTVLMHTLLPPSPPHGKLGTHSLSCAAGQQYALVALAPLS